MSDTAEITRDLPSHFDPHILFHQNGKETDSAECRECIINADHKERFRALIAEYGSPFGPQPKIVLSMFDAAAAITMKEATEFAKLNLNDDGTPVIRHDKTQKMNQFVVAHHGEEVTLAQIIEGTEAASGTVYGLIRDMPLSFRKSGMSRWRVSDPVKARAEALAAPGAISPAAARNAPPTLSTAAADIAAVESAMAGITGFAPRPPTAPSKP